MSSDWPPYRAGEVFWIWTLRKGDKMAVCEAVRHPLGLTIAVMVGDDLRRTQPFRFVEH